MKMMNWIVLAAAFCLSITAGHAQEVAPGVLDADGFLNEGQGGSMVIVATTEISVEKNIVVAATMQDAANKADELTVEKTKYQEDEPAFALITSKKGGIGFIASGRASYATNATDTDSIRLAMRHAYVKAFMEAKKNLAQGFNGLSNEGRTILNESLAAIARNDESLKNKDVDLEEIIAQRAEGLIRAYAIRRVKVVEEDSAVYVTISVNGKTLGRYARPVPAIIEAVDLKTGLDQVFDEIRSGITVPAGSRAIMTDRNDICYVGYGSALIRSDDDPEMQAELAGDARKIASARALDSLTGMLVGDAVVWENRVVEKHSKSLKDFEDVSGNDSTTDRSPKGIKKFEERKRAILTQTMTNDSTQSIRRGVLPPGISSKTFRDKDNTWYYAVAIYNPVLTQAATDLTVKMKAATLIQSPRPPRRETGSAQRSAVQRPSDEIKMIPSGSFDDDDE